MRRKNEVHTDIAVIKTEILNMSENITKIELNTKDFGIVKTDVKWLKFWHNKIVLGVIAAIIFSGVLLIFKIVEKVNDPTRIENGSQRIISQGPTEGSGDFR